MIVARFVLKYKYKVLLCTDVVVMQTLRNNPKTQPPPISAPQQ